MKILSFPVVIMLCSFLFAAVPIAAEPAKKDINSATVEELMAVKRIGKKRATAIVEYIREQGAITEMEELLEVKGIGKKLLGYLKEEFDVTKEPPTEQAQ